MANGANGPIGHRVLELVEVQFRNLGELATVRDRKMEVDTAPDNPFEYVLVKRIL